MAPLRGWLRAVCFVGLISVCTGYGIAQSESQPDAAPSVGPPAAAQPAATPAASPSNPSSPSGQPAATDAPAAEPAAAQKKTYTVPAGTKVLLQLKSAVNTKSAKAGDGVYLISTFPVVVGNRVMIPNGVYVQGVVDRVQRGGRIKGKAQLDMHFTSIIFPNGSVVEIPGVVDSVPGTKNQTVKDNGEGTIEQNGDKGRNAGRTAEIALPTGAGVGTIGGASEGHPIKGGLIGLGAGLATVGVVSLFTRNADVDIPTGTQVEMVLQRPLQLEEENLAGVGPPGTAPALVPASNQPRPMTTRRPRIMCPPGSLGCE
jgi:type IV secretion system protein VirB10